MKKNRALRLIIVSIFSCIVPIYADSPKELEELLAATFAPATAQAKKLATIIKAYSDAASLGTLCCGDRVRLRHNATGYHLIGLNKPYEASKRLMVAAAKDAGSWWIVKGAHADDKRLTGDMWMPIKKASTLRLEQEGIGLNLHSQSDFFAPLAAQAKPPKRFLEVNLFGNAGIGDANDNWKLTDMTAASIAIPGTAITEVKIGVTIKLLHIASSYLLHSENLRYPDGFQEVSCSQITNDNDWWLVEDIIPGNAPDLNIFYALYGDLNTTNASKRTTVTDKLDAMSYNGTLRFPVQAVPKQPDTSLFKTFNITDPIQDTIKNLAIVYSANSSIYLHLTASEYDIIALPDFRDPKIFDLSKIDLTPPDLKILYAVYGDLNCTNIGKNGGIGDLSTVMQNVTDKVQAMIQNNQIVFDPTPKNQLFNPPAKTTPTAATTPATMPDAKAQPANAIIPVDNNKGLLILYQAGTNIYLRLIGETQSSLISATNHNQSTLIYAPIPPINSPAGFAMEVGSAKRITVGSSIGTLTVFALSTSGDELKSYNPYALTGNPWTTIPMPTAKYPSLQSLRDIAFSSDNVFLILDSKGKVYRYDPVKKTLVLLPVGAGNESLAFDFIATGNARSIWAVDGKSKTLYMYSGNKWTKANQQSVYVAAGIDGTVVSITPSGDAMLYDGKTWTAMPGSKLDRVAVCNKATIWGIKNGQLLVFTTGKWRLVKGNNGKVASGFKEIAINAAGTIFVTTTDDRICYKGEAGFFITKIETSKTSSKIQITGKPVTSRNMTRARAMQQGQLIIDANAQTKAGKLAKIKAKNPKAKP